ncbi:DUF1461 domain-containing protein [Vreelandella utahensis]|uniref:lipoprotein intramolecular transacylase Lit n=1 Tax=Vreelandella halophila TaxID=86177 RepID=UPI00098475D4|nr:DUF1461 domain-containing protein [Halomonas utahensis]
MRHPSRLLFWPAFLISHLLLSFLLAWHLLAQVNFGYALAHPLLDIQQHIHTYGPENRYKQGFDETSPEEHRALFAAIIKSIQSSGQGLEDIEYQRPDGSDSRLLREPEVVHLEDVALLVDALYWAGAGAGALGILLGWIAYRQRLRPPRPARVLAGFALVLAAGGSLLALLGPVKVFYGLHDLIFPPEHTWFFYYEDSLMTTLMKAPDLFGVIGALWLLVSLVFWGLSGWALLQLYRSRRAV